jgi:uracil-DNA glycosylase
MTPSQFVDLLKMTKFDHVFNPYSDRCEVHDLDNAPDLRAAALLKMLRAAVKAEIDAIWIGRDLGYRGGRRTGLALTDDVHLYTHAIRWDLRVERATTGPVVAERTAAVIWTMLSQVSAPIFLWNVFPFHPHDAGNPFTNRAHTRRERASGEEFLAELIRMLGPRRLVAIGNDAAQTAKRFAGRVEVINVRHPSYGGQADFLRQIECLYDVRPELRRKRTAGEA